jgi:hypothetical protein
MSVRGGTIPAMDEAEFDRRVLADARRDDEHRREIRRTRRWERITRLVGVIDMAVGLGVLAVMVAVARRQGLAAVPPPMSSRFFYGAAPHSRGPA